MRLLIHFAILKEAGGGHAVLFAVLLVVPAESLCGAYSVFRNYSLTCFEPPPQPSPTLAVVLTVNLLFYLLGLRQKYHNYCRTGKPLPIN